VGPRGGGRESERGPFPSRLLWGGSVFALLLSALLWRLRASPRTRKESRAFLRLRNATRKAGAPAWALRSPRSLTDYLDACDHPAGPWARRVVAGYLRARFSGLLVREEEEEQTLLALKEARGRLRKVSLVQESRTK